ncbi:MAG: protein kinase [Planctomycetes bacterium]|nr:protein kinase [Planctomycetota bacterium]
MQLTRIGPFALEEPLDGLAGSNVVRGVHIEHQLSMAIKLLPREVAKQAMGRSSFGDDVKKLQKIEHPGLVRIYGGAVEQGQPYLALELIEGESLRERLARRRQLPWEMAVEIVDGLAEALTYAHAQGIVHQRITPARILLPDEGGVKLTGFDCKWTDWDRVVGSRCPMLVAHYLSPEQFRGRQSASLPQCDLFSLGVILYECVTGELPWPANSSDQLRQARRDGPAPRLSTKVLDCPIWLDAIAEKLLAKVRSERLQTADETHRAIVLAKTKADAGTGAAQQAWSGKKSAFAVENDSSELQKLKRRKTKRRDTSPFYERAWFLAACLAAVIGVGVWSLWPASEEVLFARAKPLMESDSPVDWKRAEQQFLKPLLERFPDTSHSAEIEAFTARYAMHRAEERIKNLGRFGRQPKTAAERAFSEAWKNQSSGDRLSAWQKYEALVMLFAKSAEPDDQAFVKLAQRQIGRIKSDLQSSTDQIAFLEQHLDQAQSLVEEGKLLDARRILDSLISLYAGNQELRPLIERAREQLRTLDAGGAG